MKSLDLLIDDQKLEMNYTPVDDFEHPSLLDAKIDEKDLVMFKSRNLKESIQT